MRKFPSAAAILLLASCGSPDNAAQPENATHQVATVSADDKQAAEPSETPNEGSAEPAANPATPALSACVVQEGEAVPENALHAIGTEPFWAADVKGRCVTYSTPEDQAGIRVWTKFSGTAEQGTWSGALDGRPFVMTARPEQGCSDGMSDTIYPIAVTLTVRGEDRRGCAEPR